MGLLASIRRSRNGGAHFTFIRSFEVSYWVAFLMSGCTPPQMTLFFITIHLPVEYVRNPRNLVVYHHRNAFVFSEWPHSAVLPTADARHHPAWEHILQPGTCSFIVSVNSGFTSTCFKFLLKTVERKYKKKLTKDMFYPTAYANSVHSKC